jgi:hypothetical protein
VVKKFCVGVDNVFVVSVAALFPLALVETCMNQTHMLDNGEWVLDLFKT